MELGDISEDTLDRLIAAGKLEKIQVGPRKVAITWRSILQLVGGEARIVRCASPITAKGPVLPR